METPFRVREPIVEPTPDAPQAPTRPSTPINDKLAGYEEKAQDELTQEEKNLDIWEGLNRKKFITDYFGVEQFEHEFGIKMQTSQVDKYIKSELEARDYEKTVDNYKSILSEIENEIGSNKLELFSRIKKIVGYIQVLNKMRALKEKKKLYQSLDD